MHDRRCSWAVMRRNLYQLYGAEYRQTLANGRNADGGRVVCFPLLMADSGAAANVSENRSDNPHTVANVLFFVALARRWDPRRWLPR